VARVAVPTAAIRVEELSGADECLRLHRLAVGALERHLLAAFGLEVAAVPAPPRVEVRLVVRQPAEVVVEGPVLHHHDDDGFDRRVRRLEGEQAVGVELLRDDEGTRRLAAPA
jgi:hypothetical protein